MSECHEPLFDLIDDLRVTGAEVAKVHYHAGGFVLHHNTDLWRGAAPVDGPWGVWPVGAVWLCPAGGVPVVATVLSSLSVMLALAVDGLNVTASTVVGS